MYIGATSFKVGEWVGLELVEGQIGKHDGSVDGERYFACAPMRGIFLPRHRVCHPQAGGAEATPTHATTSGGSSRSQHGLTMGSHATPGAVSGNSTLASSSVAASRRDSRGSTVGGRHSPQLLTSTRDELGARLKEAEQELLNTVHAHRREMAALRKDYNALQLKFDQVKAAAAAARSGTRAGGDEAHGWAGDTHDVLGTASSAEAAQLRGSVDALTSAVAHLQADLLSARSEQERLNAESSTTNARLHELLNEQGKTAATNGNGNGHGEGHRLETAASELAAVANALRADMDSVTAASSKTTEANALLRQQLEAALQQLESNSTLDGKSLSEAVASLRQEAETLRSAATSSVGNGDAVSTPATTDDQLLVATLAELRSQVDRLSGTDTPTASTMPVDDDTTNSTSIAALKDVVAELRAELVAARQERPGDSGTEMLAEIVAELRAELATARVAADGPAQSDAAGAPVAAAMTAAAAAEALKIATGELQATVQRLEQHQLHAQTAATAALAGQDGASSNADGLDALRAALERETEMQAALAKQLQSVTEALPAAGHAAELTTALQALQTELSEARAVQAAAASETAALQAELKSALVAVQTSSSPAAEDGAAVTTALAEIRDLLRTAAPVDKSAEADAEEVPEAALATAVEELRTLLEKECERRREKEEADGSTLAASETVARSEDAESEAARNAASDAALIALGDATAALTAALEETTQAQRQANDGHAASREELEASRAALAQLHTSLEQQLRLLETRAVAAAEVAEAAELRAAQAQETEQGKAPQDNETAAADSAADRVASASALKAAMDEIVSAKAEAAVLRKELELVKAGLEERAAEHQARVGDLTLQIEALREQEAQHTAALEAGARELADVRRAADETRTTLQATLDATRTELAEAGEARARLEGLLEAAEKAAAAVSVGQPLQAVDGAAACEQDETSEGDAASEAKTRTPSTATAAARNSAPHLHIMTARPMLLESQAALQRLLGSHFEQLQTLREMQSDAGGEGPVAEALGTQIDGILAERLAEVAERLTQCEDALDIWCSRLNDQAVPVPDEAVLEGDEFY